MAGITASQVKELRERTGAGMMECKRALVDSDGDIDIAIENMRKAGLAKADKKAGRVAAEGLIVVASTEDGHAAAVVEVNCETDFVAKNEDFRHFADELGQLVLEESPADSETLLALSLASGDNVEQSRRELIAKIGENISIRRFVRFQSDDGRVSSYRHGTRIGVLVEMKGGDEDLGRDIAMHVAASRPDYVRPDEVPAEVLAKEREILGAQAKESGKPDNIVEKMVEGRLHKYLRETTLLGQPFVKNPDQDIESLLKSADAQVIRFTRFELGEGIERKSGDFAEEVMAQVRGG